MLLGLVGGAGASCVGSTMNLEARLPVWWDGGHRDRVMSNQAYMLFQEITMLLITGPVQTTLRSTTIPHEHQKVGN